MKRQPVILTDSSIITFQIYEKQDYDRLVNDLEYDFTSLLDNPLQHLDDMAEEFVDRIYEILPVYMSLKIRDRLSEKIKELEKHND